MDISRSPVRPAFWCGALPIRNCECIGDGGEIKSLGRHLRDQNPAQGYRRPWNPTLSASSGRALAARPLWRCLSPHKTRQGWGSLIRGCARVGQPPHSTRTGARLGILRDCAGTPFGSSRLRSGRQSVLVCKFLRPVHQAICERWPFGGSAACPFRSFRASCFGGTIGFRTGAVPDYANSFRYYHGAQRLQQENGSSRCARRP